MIVDSRGGMRSWQAGHAPDDLPTIITGTEFMSLPKPEPPQLIAGVLHQGSAMSPGVVQ